MTREPTDHWFRPITLNDYLRIPGVLDVRERDGSPGTATLIVREGCEGIARILRNSGVTMPGLEIREEVQEGMPEL